MFQGLVEIDQSLLDLARFLKSHAKTGQGFGIMRFNTQGFVITGHGFRMTIEFLQYISAIKPLFRRGGIKADGFIEIGQSLAQTSEFLQRRAANAKALRMFRVTPQNLVAGQNCLFGTAQLQQNIGAIG